MRLIFLGPPGAGKGTHAKLLAEKLRLTHIAAGDCFRKHIRGETPLGKKAKDLIDKGDLVPDKLVNEMMEEEMWRSKTMSKGFILDGYPRTVKQAEALEKYAKKEGFKLDAAVNFKATEKVIIDRLSGRRISPSTGRVYHVKNMPPKKPGICDFSGEELIQRPDDVPETIKHRLEVYEKETMPIIDFYKSRGLLKEVNGDDVLEPLHSALLEICEDLKEHS